MLTREQALELLRAENTSESLLKHAFASEAVMTALANRLQENATLWGLTGLLHDLDYPKLADCPERHGLEAAEKLQAFLPTDALDAIKAHNGELNGCPPKTKFDYALRCGESVTGLITAAALMRPTGYEGMSVKSIKKKMKDKAFAAGASRENIKQCEQIGLALDEFLELAIKAISEIEPAIK